MKEKMLAERLARDDTKALGKIVMTYSDYVRAVARNFSRGGLSEADIDELVSDVFFGLWKNRARLDPELGLRPYLSAAVRNGVKNRFKSAPPPCGDIDELEPASDISVDEAAELSEMTRCLYEGIRLLPESEREIFFRFYFYGESSPEIAKTMKMEENTVYTKLRRTRSRLKEFLIERGYDHV